MLSITKVSTNDLQHLQNISIQTFKETFEYQNSPTDMEIYLKDHLSLHQLKNELNNINSQFYFAKQFQDIIGYLKINFNTAQTELKNANSMEIERIYVIQKHIGQNIGKTLFQKAIEIAHDKKVDFIWLGVWEKNTQAINFYQKKGFIPFDSHIFQLGNDQQTDILMKLKL